jgi:hypothetical protein
MALALEPIWRRSSAASLDDDLAAVWRDAASAGPVSRAVMSNLVIVRSDAGPPVGEGGISEEMLTGVLRVHPARTILVDYAAEPARTCAPESFAINVLLFAGGTERYGVERIAVRTACADTSLPSVVRRLVRGDLPTTLWWLGDAARWPLPHPLLNEARQLLFDSHDWSDVPGAARSIADAAAQAGRLDLSDLNWRRTAPLRRAILGVLSTGAAAFRENITASVTVSRHETAAGWLLGAWLARAALLEPIAPDIAEDSSGFNVRMTVEGRAATLTARWAGAEIRVDSTTQRHPVVIPAPPEDPATAIASELDNLTAEPALRDAVQLLAGKG